MQKTISLVCLFLAAGLLAGYLALAANASPVFGGPALAGIALGRPDGDLRIVGRHLSCAGAEALTTCSVDVGGRPLRVTVGFADPYHDEFTRCEAEYAGGTFSCEASRYAIQSPGMARVDAAALGLTEADLAAVIARYPGSDWPEGGWTWLGMGTALLSAALAGLAVGGWVGRPVFGRRFWITTGLVSLGWFFAAIIGLMTVISGLALVD